MKKKKVLILGIDGYIGWPLALHLLNKGYKVSGIDNLSRRERVKDLGSDSLTPILHPVERSAMFNKDKNFGGFYLSCNLHDSAFYIKKLLIDTKPDVIVHLAEQPSAPWSMKGSHECAITQHENVIGNLNLLWAMKEVVPDAHLIKLGTMGEYGKPDCEIPEGEIPNDCINYPRVHRIRQHCPLAGLPFPRSPNSFYHLSKVHDTHNIIFACKTWGLTSTDIMQGVVFGLMNTKPSLITRFDYDECFGTVINRFCTQVISDHPLTIYGSGRQSYSFLPLKDSIQCINLIIDNPPLKGKYRTINQFESIHSINNLANKVMLAGANSGLNPKLTHIPNPRTESEDHQYNPVRKKLHKLGYKPTKDIQGEINNLVKSLLLYKDRVKKEVLIPKTNWR